MRGGVYACDLGEIDRSDQAHRARVLLQLDPLMRNIRAEGLQRPVVLRDTGVGRLQIVCGFRRIEAAARLGFKQLRARVLSSVGDENAFDHAWEENTRLKSLSDVDRGRGIQIYRERYGRTVSELTLKLELSHRQIHRLCSLADAPAEVQAAMAEGWLSGTTADKLLAGLRRVGRERELTHWLTRIRRERLSGSALTKALQGGMVEEIFCGDLLSIERNTATFDHQIEFKRKRMDLSDASLLELADASRELRRLQDLIEERRYQLLSEN